VTGPKFVAPAGHELRFFTSLKDSSRLAGCTGCLWNMAAPGTGRARYNVEHILAHETQAAP
jgi:hypothetical protein